MKLTHTITGHQLVDLLNQTDRRLVLALHDQRTGAVRKLTITADMAALPDEALLLVEVAEVDDQPVDLAAWWGRGDELRLIGSSKDRDSNKHGLPVGRPRNRSRIATPSTNTANLSL